MAQTAIAQTLEEIEAVRTLPETKVSAEKVVPEVGVRTYTREDIETGPQGNRDLTSLIANNPAVRINPSMDGNGNRGSLVPESFSIHGQSPYQNQFLIDGISLTNSISPQEGATGLQVGRVPGYSQAFNVDTDLLDQVVVYDNRVPVEFGHFQGGVVDARIKTPTGSNRWKVDYRFNSSQLTQQHMPAGVAEKWHNGVPGYSAVWKKHFATLKGDVRLTEDSAALLSYSRRSSNIARQRLVMDTQVAHPNGKATSLETGYDQDAVENLLLKLHTRWSADTQSNVLFKYADRQEALVSNLFADSSWTNRQRVYGLGTELVHAVSAGQITAKLGVDQMDNLRQSSSTAFVTQQFDQSWGLAQYSSGGYGTEALNQQQVSAKLRMDWNPWQFGSVQHQFYAGWDWQGTQAEFERQNDAYAYRAVMQPDGSQRDYSKTQYMAGTAKVDYSTLGWYVSDSMQWRNFSWTVGARVDRDQWLKNTNFAPRTRWDWDIGGTGRTQFGFGWSRYYGLDILGYALKSEKSRLQRMLVNSKGEAVDTPATPEIHDYAGLQTPYTDEWAAQLTQHLNDDWEAGVSYVHRAGHGEVTREGNSDTGYFYANGGRSTSETAVLSLRALQRLRALGAQWSGRADFSWQRKARNNNAEDGWEAGLEEPDDIIEVDGVLMPRGHKQAGDFTHPYELSVSWTGVWKSQGVRWGNRVNWKSEREAIIFVGTKSGVERYSTDKLASYWTWDTHLTWSPQQWSGVTVGVEVLNLLDRMPVLAVATPTAAENVRTKTGREIWLSASYEF